MDETGIVQLVIGFNCVIALLILGATYWLWIGKQSIRQLSAWLSVLELNPQQWRYVIALQRVQLAEQRLEVAKWQRRSRQLTQLIQLVQLLRTIALMQSGRYSLLYGRRVSAAKSAPKDRRSGRNSDRRGDHRKVNRD